MHQAPTPMRLFRLLRGRFDAPAADDAADMGTAFGLDMSLLPDPPAADPPPLRTLQRGWLHRLARRRAAAG